MPSYTKRTRCALCNSNSLSVLHSYDSYPISLSTTSSTLSDDSAPLTFASCDTCECVQILELVNPSVLYAETHNNTAATPTWKEHHRQFAEFILTKSNGNSFFEVGGAEGVLASHLCTARPNAEYTCLDLCKPALPLKGVTHIAGNCETYLYNDRSANIIASHVFEHLYQPEEFVKRLESARVNSIFLSIPNMKAWLDTNVLSFLHREHTFYCNRYYLESVFNRHGYTLQSYTPFKGHSEFFHFTFDGKNNVVAPTNPGGLVQKFRTYLARREERLQRIQVSGPTYIFPAGHYGQLVYMSIAQKGCEILGFLDNDPSKIGHRMYGTPHFVESPIILCTRTEPCTVLLVASVYAAEIREQLQKLCPNIDIVDL